jgi:hypothetical protein
MIHLPAYMGYDMMNLLQMDIESQDIQEGIN